VAKNYYTLYGQLHSLSLAYNISTTFNLHTSTAYMKFISHKCSKKASTN